MVLGMLDNLLAFALPLTSASCDRDAAMKIRHVMDLLGGMFACVNQYQGWRVIPDSPLVRCSLQLPRVIQGGRGVWL